MPLGGMCRDLLRDLQAELDNPGALMREKLERSLRVVKEEEGQLAEKRRIIHILVNMNSSRAVNFVEKMDILAEQNDFDINNAKANLLLSKL